MSMQGFTPPVPLPVRTARVLRCARRPSASASVRAVMSSEQVASEKDAVPVPAVNAMFESNDIAESAFQSMEDVEDILGMAEEFDLRDLRISDHGFEIEITREGGRGFEGGDLAKLPEPRVVNEIIEAASEEVFDEETLDNQLAEEEIVAGEEAKEEKDPDQVYESDFVVTSNRVGFFFSGAKNKPPLVNVGDKVGFNQPVCIIEQLGQQYVYLSEASGTVLKIFVEDGDAVEYGQQVMVIRPD